MTLDRPPAGHRKPPRLRPSVWAAWLWENHEVSNLWYWPALVLLRAVSLSFGYVQFMEYRAEFLTREATWVVIWGQSLLMLSMLFIPLVIGAFTTQSAAGEHEGRNWQCMSTSGLAGTIVADKLLHTMQITLVSTLVFLTEFIVIGLLLGSNPAELGPCLARVVSIVLSMWVVEVFIVQVGTITNSFAAIMSILLLTIIRGLVLSLIVPPVAGLCPLSPITSVFAPRQPDGVTSVGSMLVTGFMAAVWVVFWVSVLLRRIARNP